MRRTEKILRIAAVTVGECLACGTGIALLRSGDGERLLLSFGTMVLVLLPALLEHLFRCKINTALYLFAVAYATGPMMGHCWKFYYTVPCWDRLLHLCGGVVFAVLGLYLFEQLSRGQVKHIAGVIFALCFSLAISVAWEFVEYGADTFLGMDMQDDTVVTEINSYLLGEERGHTGSLRDIHSVVIDGTPLPVEGYIDVGLHDTMRDMLLESLGALLTCLVLLLDKGRHPLISAHERKEANDGDILRTV